MIAVKENRRYRIRPEEAEARRADGYDIYEDDGVTLVAHCRGKTVPYEVYAALEAECGRLRAARRRKKEED